MQFERTFSLVTKMRICVLGGAGHIGSGVMRALVKRAPDAEVVIADKNLEEAEELVAELGGKISTQSVDANDSKSLIKMMKDVDIAIGAIGPYYTYGVKVLKAAIDAKTNFVDIDDDYDATKACLALHEGAKKAGITATIGLGATPGLTNILAKYGSEKLDKVDEIHTAWAWTAMDPFMGPAIIAHYFHASTGDVPTYRDGKWVEISALSEPEVVEFPPPLSEIEVYNVGHPEPVTIPRYIKGVKVVTNKGTVWPSLMTEASKMFAKLGLISLKDFTIKGVTMPVRDVAVQFVMSIPDLTPAETISALATEAEERYGEYALEGVGLKVKVKGESQGKTICYSYGVACRSAVVCTATPAALGALMVTAGKVKEKGVFAPEGVIDSKSFLKEIAKDIEVLETEEKAGKL